MNTINRSIVIVAIVGSIGGMVYVFDYLPMAQKAQRLVQEISVSETRLGKAHATINSAQNFKTTNEVWLNNYLAASSDDQMSATMMGDLQKAAAQQQLSLSVLNTRGVTSLKKQKVFSVALRTEGTLSDLIEFIAQIEEWPQRFHINTFSLKINPQDAKKLVCQMELNKIFFIGE